MGCGSSAPVAADLSHLTGAERAAVLSPPLVAQQQSSKALLDAPSSPRAQAADFAKKSSAASLASAASAASAASSTASHAQAGAAAPHAASSAAAASPAAAGAEKRGRTDGLSYSPTTGAVVGDAAGAAAQAAAEAHGIPSFPDELTHRLQPSLRPLSERYEIDKKVLGVGGFGEVRGCTRRADGRRMAVKTISKLKFAGEAERALMVDEVQLMHRVRGHANVVELAEWSEDQANFYMIVELCTGGELMERIVKEDHFSERVASRLFRQMAAGVQWCHSRLVCHRDIKPENFLFESREPGALLKITDFGLACVGTQTHAAGGSAPQAAHASQRATRSFLRPSLTPSRLLPPSPPPPLPPQRASLPQPLASADALIEDACGSAYYIAPEVFQRAYSKEADVFSLGVNLFLMLSGTVPFGAHAKTEEAIYSALQTEPLRFEGAWQRTTPAVRELLSGLLEKTPEKRYTLAQVLAHPWVAGDAASDTKIDRTVLASLMNFTAKNKFKKEALRLAASAMTASDVAQLRAAFMRLDADNSGFITFSELTAEVGKLGVSDYTRIGEAMGQMDADGDGQISYEEFITAVVDRQLVHHQNKVWWAFCEYDLDGDGKITRDELSRALAMNGEAPERLAGYIAEFDTDGDGSINYEEFMRMLLPKDVKFRVKREVPVSESRKAALVAEVTAKSAAAAAAATAALAAAEEAAVAKAASAALR
jgi:calcium-dependent protein kinase